MVLSPFGRVSIQSQTVWTPMECLYSVHAWSLMRKNVLRIYVCVHFVWSADFFKVIMQNRDRASMKLLLPRAAIKVCITDEKGFYYCYVVQSGHKDTHAII